VSHDLNRSTITRRAFVYLGLGSLVGVPLRVVARSEADTVAAPPLTDLVRHPLLVRSLYRLSVTENFNDDGAAGANRKGYQWIEEQRQGAEWVLRGRVQGRNDWVARGWKQLDWGLSRQQGDGGFGSKDPFHSTSFFIEALARSCILDPEGANATRLDGLARGAHWLMRPDIEARGVRGNLPYTHRRYILAAALGQSAQVTGVAAFRSKAVDWAQQGLALQRPDGTNPEKDGYDSGYQMVGVLMALRYLPVCTDPQLRARLRAMVQAAVRPELARLRPDGSVDPSGSTRIEKERARNGKIKDVPYGEIMQALVYGALEVPRPEWIEPAQRIADYRRWLRG
jgi:hypothetical protein